MSHSISSHCLCNYKFSYECSSFVLANPWSLEPGGLSKHGDSADARATKRKRVSAGTKEVEDKMLVAVDFGTTFSALSCCPTRTPDLRDVITQWPDGDPTGLEGHTSKKVPTEIQYIGDKIKWGFEIKESTQRHKWFKLELDPSAASNRFNLIDDLPDRYALPPPYELDPEKLVTDYLRALVGPVDNYIKNTFGESVLRDTPKEYIITVPGNWPHASQQKTRACAARAGLGTDLAVVSEPEAAAIYAIKTLNPSALDIGDTFILCDCGGGTVDLISYKISALKPILKVTEAVPGTGAVCGSTIIDRLFENFLRRKFVNNEEFAEYEDEILDEVWPVLEVHGALTLLTALKAMTRFQVVRSRSVTLRSLPDTERVFLGQSRVQGGS